MRWSPRMRGEKRKPSMAQAARPTRFLVLPPRPFLLNSLPKRSGAVERRVYRQLPEIVHANERAAHFGLTFLEFPVLLIHSGNDSFSFFPHKSSSI
jgi:hypothetical protein